MKVKKGTVTKTGQSKTVIVTIHSYRNHPKYKKRYKISKKFHVHNPGNKQFNIGDKILFYETRPISKLKKWTVETPTTKKD